ncbi:MAG: uncharacterized protein QOI77_2995 [Blastocatellia bacterium]|jgi:uncharacterized DUF497 family protein|nr:uncharacterized protein [Blastocatellia bacterium]
MRKGLLEFEWDSKKAASNLRKHGISFEEAASVFSDVLASVYQDPDHSAREQRYLTMAHPNKDVCSISPMRIEVSELE